MQCALYFSPEVDKCMQFGPFPPKLSLHLQSPTYEIRLIIVLDH